MFSKRQRIALLVLAAAAGIALIATLVAASRSGRDGGSAAVVHQKSKFEGAERPRIKVADFALKDEQGRSVRLSDQRGKAVALTFLYSTCEDSCPYQAQLIRGALDDLGDKGDKVESLAVSARPEVDTVKNVRRFLIKQRVLGKIRYLTGPRTRLKPIWKEFGIQPQSEKFEHSSYIILLDKQGRQAVGHPSSQTNSELIAHDLKLLLKE